MRDIESGKDLTDHIKWAKFSGASWTKDNTGFFYSRYDAPNEATKLADINYFQKLYFHKIGTPQSESAVSTVPTRRMACGAAPSATTAIIDHTGLLKPETQERVF